MPKDFFFLENSFFDQNEAESHFESSYGLYLINNPTRRFDYESRMCILGDSCISITTTTTGWGYHQPHVILDGFVGTILETGSIAWQTCKGHFRSKPNEIFLLDHRDLINVRYESNARYLGIWLSHSDIFNYLCLLIGETPKSRIFFTTATAGRWETQCILELARVIIAIGSNSSPSARRSLTHLKESLIGFWLYNISNNYSQYLSNPDTIRKLAPHCVNLVAEYIQFNSDEDITVGQLASSAGVSIRALQLGFKKFKNTTPMNYLRDVRLKKARLMLLDENCDLSAQGVAMKCGFTNYYLFCKYYRLAFYEKPIETKPSNPRK